MRYHPKLGWLGIKHMPLSGGERRFGYQEAHGGLMLMFEWQARPGWSSTVTADPLIAASSGGRRTQTDGDSATWETSPEKQAGRETKRARQMEPELNSVTHPEDDPGKKSSASGIQKMKSVLPPSRQLGQQVIVLSQVQPCYDMVKFDSLLGAGQGHARPNR